MEYPHRAISLIVHSGQRLADGVLHHRNLSCAIGMVLSKKALHEIRRPY
jgi:hypothetical protein